MEQRGTALNPPDAYSEHAGRGADWSPEFVAFLRSAERGRVHFGRPDRRRGAVVFAHPDFPRCAAFVWMDRAGIHIVPCLVAKWQGPTYDRFWGFASLVTEVFACSFDTRDFSVILEANFALVSPSDSRTMCRLLMAQVRLGQH